LSVKDRAFLKDVPRTQNEKKGKWARSRKASIAMGSYYDNMIFQFSYNKKQHITSAQQ
jgi:hypothetical protein